MDQAQATAPIFQNDHWIVTADGLDHREIDYFIPAEALAQRRHDGLWLWPLQLAEKTWCAAGPFAEAFLHALRTFGHRRDEQLGHSLAAFGLPAGFPGEPCILAEAAEGAIRGSRAAAHELRGGATRRGINSPPPAKRRTLASAA